MINPIKNNRLVSNKTFAIRFKNFVESVNVADACSEDEKDAMLNVANSLLNYQLHTVDDTDTEETEYLERIGLYPIQPLFTTHDGVDLYANDEDGVEVYSCMTTPRVGDVILPHNIKNAADLAKINQKRLLFWSDNKANSYLESNTKTISIQDLIDSNLYEAYEQNRQSRR